MGFSKFDLTPRIGTQIKTDIDALLGGKHVEEIRDALEQRGVLVFKELHLTEEQQKAFSSTTGTLLPQEGKDVLNISLDRSINGPTADYLIGSFYWHVDLVTTDTPTRASLPTARKLSDTGGDTCFANAYAAWDDLPEEERKALEALRVVHSFETTQRMFRPEPTYAELLVWQKKKPKTHPLVWTHRTGRKSLMLGAAASHVEGMSLEEGRLLLCRLQEWVTQPQSIYRHKWTLGDLVIWDNTGTMHRVNPYSADSGRLMIRTALAGEESVA